MQIFHEAHASAITHDDVVYPADRDGNIDVPQHVGEAIIRRPGWHVAGWEPTLTDAEQAEKDAVEKAELVARVATLERELAKRPRAKS